MVEFNDGVKMKLDEFKSYCDTFTYEEFTNDIYPKVKNKSLVQAYLIERFQKARLE